MKVLVLNSGSSSQKSCLYDIGATLSSDPPDPVWEGKIEWDGDKAECSIRNSCGKSFKQAVASGSRGDAIERLLQGLWSGETQAISGPPAIDVVGHRVVHGGPRFLEPALVNADVKAAIKDAAAFAPLHSRAELEGMETIAKLFGTVQQVAVFDTGFHRTIPPSAAAYPGPFEWLGQGIRRYGFHGINHQYCAQRAAQLLQREAKSLRLVSCHLGNGCSLAAIRNGHSVDTTMGFTPLEGLMMGTRSGSIDPGIVTYLVRQQHRSGEELDDILNKQSGLLGISGVSSDMRDILAAVGNGHERAKLAFDMYIHRLHLGIGSMIAVLGGVDALIFTAGVGENSSEVRAAVCENFAFMGLKVDGEKNVPSPEDREISAREATVRVLVVHAQEDWMIARECWNLVPSAVVSVRH